MQHYVKYTYHTPSDEGRIISFIYAWNMSATQELVYDDEEKTLVMWDNGKVLWKETDYNPDKDMEDYIKHEYM